jgi:NDP-sugar pyrophosphorylase family protein
LYIINPGVLNTTIKENSDFSYDIIPQLLSNNKNIYGYKIKKNKLWPIDTPELFFKARNELNIT